MITPTTITATTTITIVNVAFAIKTTITQPNAMTKTITAIPIQKLK